MVSFKGKSILLQYMPKTSPKWGFKIWGRSGVPGFLYNFDVYQGRSNKKVSGDLGMSSQVVKSLCESLPSGHNFNFIANNFFTSLPLVDELKRNAMYFVETVRIPRLKNCSLMVEKDLKMKRRGANDYRVKKKKKR